MRIKIEIISILQISILSTKIIEIPGKAIQTTPRKIPPRDKNIELLDLEKNNFREICKTK